jgi:hypothetical protein
VVVLQNFGLLNGLSFIIVIGAASLLLLFILFALVIEVTRVFELFVFLLAVGLFQIFTAFVIDNRVGLVEALDVVGHLVVAHAEVIFAVIVVVSAKTALGVLVGCGDLDRGFFTIEADSNVTVGDADQVLAVVDSVFLEGVLVLFMLTIDLDGEFAILGLNLDAVTVGDHFEGLLLVVDLLQQDGEAWLLTSAVLGQNGIALGQWGLEGHIIEGADLAAGDLAFLALFGGIVADDVGEGVNGFLDLSWLDELEWLDLGWEAQRVNANDLFGGLQGDVGMFVSHWVDDNGGGDLSIALLAVASGLEFGLGVPEVPALEEGGQGVESILGFWAESFELSGDVVLVDEGGLLDHLLTELLSLRGVEAFDFLDLFAPLLVAGLLSIDVQVDLLLVLRSPFTLGLGDELLLFFSLLLLVLADAGVDFWENNLGFGLHGPLVGFFKVLEWGALGLQLNLGITVLGVASGFNFELSVLVVAATNGFELDLDVVFVHLAWLEVVEEFVELALIVLILFVVLAHFIIESGLGVESFEVTVVAGFRALLEEAALGRKDDLVWSLFSWLEFDVDVVFGRHQSLDNIFVFGAVWDVDFTVDLEWHAKGVFSVNLLNMLGTLDEVLVFDAFHDWSTLLSPFDFAGVGEWQGVEVEDTELFLWNLNGPFEGLG